MPNGMRSYYLNRSQPPLLSQVGRLWGHASCGAVGSTRLWHADRTDTSKQVTEGRAARQREAQSHRLLCTAGWPNKHNGCRLKFCPADTLCCCTDGGGSARCCTRPIAAAPSAGGAAKGARILDLWSQTGVACCLGMPAHTAMWSFTVQQAAACCEPALVQHLPLCRLQLACKLHRLSPCTQLLCSCWFHAGGAAWSRRPAAPPVALPCGLGPTAARVLPVGVSACAAAVVRWLVQLTGSGGLPMAGESQHIQLECMLPQLRQNKTPSQLRIFLFNLDLLVPVQ